ncbi:MAG: hypothetical protein ACK4UO_09120 [Pseudolabrys sp.]
MNADESIVLLRNILEEQQATNRWLEKLTKMSAIYFEAMAERFYQLDGEPVLNVAVVSRYRDDD